MTYVNDPCGNGQPGPVDEATVVLVGCGGTGAFLAEALCRLLIGRRGSLHLVDPDLIEPRNALRQAYAPAEAGRSRVGQTRSSSPSSALSNWTSLKPAPRSSTKTASQGSGR